MAESLVHQILENKELEVYAFYEELPIKVKIKLLDVDFDKEQLIWKFEKKLELPLSNSKELYFEKNGVVYTLVVIIYNKEEMITSFPTIAVEPKIKRRYIRVRTTEKHPVVAYIGDLKLNVVDISEKGMGILNNDYNGLEVGKTYDINLNIEGKEYTIQGEVVYIKEITKNTYRIGIQFKNLKPKIEDEIFQYILARQKEVLKKISLFS